MCEHRDFQAVVTINRIADCPTGFMADVRIKCADCGIPFEFVGLPSGLHFEKPMVSIDSTELRAPIKPSSDPVDQVNSFLK